eukprot:scaffold1220_cov259-Pinguiococcus_pyrenoidosus.AAC.2
MSQPPAPRFAGVRGLRGSRLAAHTDQPDAASRSGSAAASRAALSSSAPPLLLSAGGGCSRRVMRCMSRQPRSAHRPTCPRQRHRHGFEEPAAAAAPPLPTPLLSRSRRPLALQPEPEAPARASALPRDWKARPSRQHLQPQNPPLPHEVRGPSVPCYRNDTRRAVTREHFGFRCHTTDFCGRRARESEKKLVEVPGARSPEPGALFRKGGLGHFLRHARHQNYNFSERLRKSFDLELRFPPCLFKGRNEPFLTL